MAAPDSAAEVVIKQRRERDFSERVMGVSLSVVMVVLRCRIGSFGSLLRIALLLSSATFASRRCVFCSTGGMLRLLSPLQFIGAVARAGSIRKAAEGMALTSTALNRRVLALDEELGVPIFERLPRGVRLSTAGELLIHHLRTQQAELEKLKSQIADLAGERRGHVSIACSQAFLPFFLPEQIGAYRRKHQGVTFGVRARDRECPIPPDDDRPNVTFGVRVRDREACPGADEADGRGGRSACATVRRRRRRWSTTMPTSR